MDIYFVLSFKTPKITFFFFIKDVLWDFFFQQYYMWPLVAFFPLKYSLSSSYLSVVSSSGIEIFICFRLKVIRCSYADLQIVWCGIAKQQSQNSVALVIKTEVKLSVSKDYFQGLK